MRTEAENKIDYIEIPARDVAASKKFFADLFGWEFTDYGPDYTSFSDGRMFGGFSKADTVASEAGGSVGKLAKRVGMERTHLYRKLRSLGIDHRKGAE